MMTSTEVISSALMKRRKTQREAADVLGWSPQNFNLRMKRNTVPFEEMTTILQHCGYDVRIVDSDGKELPHFGNGTGARVVKKVCGKQYDTSKASAVASTTQYQGRDCFAELYENVDGEYFVVSYESGRNTVSPIDEETAKNLMGKWTTR